MSQGPPKREATVPRRQSAWTPTRPHKRGCEPASLAEVLVGTQDLMAQRAGSAIPRGEWHSIVGQRIASRTRVGKLWKGVLTIKVASSAWSNELSLLKSTLIGKLQRAGRDVNDLRFVVTNIDRPRQMQKRPRFKSSATPPPREVPQLPQSLLERLREIDDPNLREAIAEAARSSLATRKT